MISKRATAIASVLVLALAAAPISSAFASDRHHGGYGHGGGNYAYYNGNPPRTDGSPQGQYDNRR